MCSPAYTFFPAKFWMSSKFAGRRHFIHGNLLSMTSGNLHDSAHVIFLPLAFSTRHRLDTAIDPGTQSPQQVNDAVIVLGIKTGRDHEQVDIAPRMGLSREGSLCASSQSSSDDPLAPMDEGHTSPTRLKRGPEMRHNTPLVMVKRRGITRAHRSQLLSHRYLHYNTSALAPGA